MYHSWTPARLTRTGVKAIAARIPHMYGTKYRIIHWYMDLSFSFISVSFSLCSVTKYVSVRYHTCLALLLLRLAPCKNEDFYKLGQHISCRQKEQLSILNQWVHLCILQKIWSRYLNWSLNNCLYHTIRPYTPYLLDIFPFLSLHPVNRKRERFKTAEM